jgi:hypothetical protein
MPIAAQSFVAYAPLPEGIQKVLALSSYEQMGRPHARPVVAIVTDNQVPWDVTVYLRHDPSVSANGLTAHIEQGITVRLSYGALPRPASSPDRGR